MIDLKNLKIVLFFNVKEINIFDFNNKIFEIYGDKLKGTQPSVFGDNAIANVPLSLWKSKDISITYTKTTFEIVLSNEYVNLQQENAICNDLESIIAYLNMPLLRIGMVFEMILSDDFHTLFLKKYNCEIMNAKEFNISWLKNFESKVRYNFWTHYQYFNNSRNLVFDINTEAGQQICESKNVINDILIQYKKEVEEWKVN